MRANFDEQNERLVAAIEGMYSRLADVSIALERIAVNLDKITQRPLAHYQVLAPSWRPRSNMWWDGSEWRDANG